VASWAAAGMLAAAVETEPGEQALLALTLDRRPAHVALFCARTRGGIRHLGRLSRRWVQSSSALTRDDAEQLRFTFDFQKSLGLDLEWLSGAEARRREPHLRPGISGAVFSPRDHQVDNRRLARALAEGGPQGRGRTLRA